MKTTINHWLLMLLSLLVLSGCGGASGSNEVTTTPTIGAKLTFSVTDAQGNSLSSTQATSIVLLKAKATNDFGSSVSGVTITFSTDLGSLSATTALTGSDGIAEVTLTTTSSDIGVASFTADGTVDGKALTTTGQLELTEFVNSATPVLTLTTLDASCSNPLNSQSSGDTFCLQANLTQDGQPMSNEVVTFSASLGSLSPDSALTNSSGIARVLLQSSSNDLGAGTATATSQGLTASQNYQLVASQGSLNLSIALYAQDCITPQDSFASGATVCVEALLTNNGAAVENEIINFDFPLGTLRQTSALTNTNGIARVQADSTGTELGAATASATHANLSTTQNYEFVASSTVPTTSPKIELATFLSSVPTNSFQAEITVQLQAKVLDADGVAIPDAIVTFTAERGVLSTNAALTNSEGKAEVNLTGSVDNIGAAVATAQVSVEGSSYTQTHNYEILSSGAVQLESALIGYFDAEGVFQSGKIGASLPLNSDEGVDLSAGGTMGLNVVVVNDLHERITTPTPVTFSSACATDNRSNLDTQVTTVNGEARATYEDVSCATVNGNQDGIVATMTANNVSLSANLIVKLLPETIGSIEFISAEPTSIVLQGTGGQGKQETSTLTFQVKGVLGNPLSQQEVTFTLDSGVGDLTISPDTSLTNSQGLVTTRVTSGQVPSAIRVTATTSGKDEDGNDISIATQSDLLSINTGLPDQNSITLASTLLNSETAEINGTQATIVAYMADSFNNPVPDGTTISFTTEGGFIEPSCNTTNGTCEVLWTAANPRVDDHRITVLATAIGHETFFDTNGNNVFDDDDGIAINQNIDSGIGRGSYESSGFVDMSEAWRDDNENRIHDSGEIFIDFNNDNVFSGPDGFFNGPQCTGALCATDNAKINVRKALIMIMSSNNVRYTLMTSDLTPGTNSTLSHIGERHVLASNDSQSNVQTDGMVTVSNAGTSTTTDGFITIGEGLSLPLQLVFADDAAGLGQILPADTSISVSATVGGISGTSGFTVPNSVGYISADGSDRFGGNEISFNLVNTNSPSTPNESNLSGSLIISFTFPDSNAAVSFSLPILLLGN